LDRASNIVNFMVMKSMLAFCSWKVIRKEERSKGEDKRGITEDERLKRKD
jgi:hypothetical protein